ncbi:hypothetical protein H0H93_011462 [Arthromyces matolae]|nr:hypothetical protein H0H93_011462 [Arthromyces matolae]
MAPQRSTSAVLPVCAQLNPKLGVVDVSSDESADEGPATPPSSPAPSDVEEPDSDAPNLITRQVKTTTVTTVEDGITKTTSTQVVTEKFAPSPKKPKSGLPSSGTPRPRPPTTPSRKSKPTEAVSTPSQKKRTPVASSTPSQKKRAPVSQPSVEEDTSLPEASCLSHSTSKSDHSIPSFNPVKPHYSFLQLPDTEAEAYYVVIRGKETGIFDNWLHVASISKRFGGTWRKFSTWREAHKHYKQAWEKGQVSVVN